MKTALSMYLGGVIINATEADYNTSRQLGCTCTVCSEAVFLRAGSTRIVGQQEQVIRPAFVHYKSDEIRDCENRIYNKQSIQKAAEIEAEGRNQRLKLYNKRLWDLMSKNHVFPETIDKSTKSILGGNLIKSQGKKVHSYARSIKDINEYVSDCFASTRDQRKINIQIEKAESEEVKKFYSKSTDKLNHYFKHECDQRLHLNICCEIGAFLQTKTAGYFWKKLILNMMLTTFFRLVDKEGAERQKAYAENMKNIQDASAEEYFEKAISFIVETKWIDLINDELNFTEEKIS